MLDEKFAQGETILHNMDGRSKVITAAAYVIAVASTSDLITAWFALVIGVVMVSLAKLPVSDVIKRLVLVNTFTLFLWLILPFTYDKAAATAKILNIAVYQGGIDLAYLITLKTNAIILYIISLLATSTIATIGQSLQSLGVPDRLCFLLLFSYRNVIVMYKEYRKLLCAAQMRNFTPTTSIHTYRTYAYLFGMTLVKSWNRGERIQEAMLLRGFNGQLHTLESPSLQRSDYVFLAINLTLVVLLVLSPSLLS